jgi:hypothetical protein
MLDRSPQFVQPNPFLTQRCKGTEDKHVRIDKAPIGAFGIADATLGIGRRKHTVADPATDVRLGEPGRACRKFEGKRNTWEHR